MKSFDPLNKTVNELTSYEAGASPDPAILKTWIYLETNGATRTWQGPECKVLRWGHKKKQILTGWNPLNSYRVPLNGIWKRTLHICTSCSRLGSFTTQKKSIAELHWLHPQIPSPKTTRRLSLNHRFSIIDSGDENPTFMHGRGCFRSQFRTACFLSCLNEVSSHDIVLHTK